MEIRNLMNAARGVGDAEALREKLPQLARHPAITSLPPASGGRPFERSLKAALANAIAGTAEKESTKAALRWQLALDTDGPVTSPKARLDRAYEMTGLTEHTYWKPRKFKKLPVVDLAIESILAVLDTLGQSERARPSIKVGGVTVPDVVPIATCKQGRTASEDMTFEFEKELRDTRVDSDEWELLRSLTPELAADAKARGRKFINGRALDLVSAEELDPSQDATRRYRIGVAETDYYRWAVTANSLDRDLSRHGKLTEALGATTLRQGWGHAPECLEDLAELPAPSYLGVCVVVVAEGQIVVLERQRKHFIAGAEPSSADRAHQPRKVHFVGEGAEPKDHADSKDPARQAALRGCFEELKLDADDIELISTAVVLDTLRWQPVFCWLAVCDLAIPDLEVRMRGAEHDEETGGGQIAALLPWTTADPVTRSLLAGTNPDMQLASNHAEAALLYALVYAEGLESAAEELSHSGG
jgi:hypothetical protein